MIQDETALGQGGSTAPKVPTNLSEMGDTVAKIKDMALEWAPKLAGAILILLVGFWIARMIVRMAQHAMDRAGIDKDLKPFLSTMLSVILKLLVAITAAGVVGIEMTAFAALIAAAGLAIGMALQGTLGHFAAGVMVLIFKPYRVGDLVDLQGQLGHVDEIQVFNTVLTSPQNKKIIIPNGIATSGIMTNLSALGKVRVDLTVGMTYEDDFEEVKRVIQNALANVTCKTDDEPTVEINAFGENGIELAVMPYSTPANYWDVYYGSYREIKKALGAAGVKVPYPVEIEISRS